ncbi:MAG: hypothetical protein GY898_19130 [Proteobacteria bacterium]|nr:hypothetical protein [Pseudomonadota bacterium]
MNPKQRAVAAVIGAGVLVAILLVASGRLPRNWHVVFVDASAAVAASPEASPRLDGLRRAGIGLSWPGGWLPDEALLIEAGEHLRDAGWQAIVAPAAPASASTTEAALEAAYANGPAGGRSVLRVRYRPASRGELDRELGRLIDGLAGPLPPARTLFVVVDRETHLAIVAGPRGLNPTALPPHGAGAEDFVPWLSQVLRIRN